MSWGPAIGTDMKSLSWGIAVVSVALVACGGAVDEPGAVSSPLSGQPVGSSCVPERENDPTFEGFVESDVSLEVPHGAKSGDPVCLIDHFRGRVSCPYGQTDDFGAREKPTCKTPKGEAVVGGENAWVLAQCVDRRAAQAVYTSCRCANVDGKTDDGDTYCACPTDFACTEVFFAIGASRTGVEGTYCGRKSNTYDPNGACRQICKGDRCP